MAVDSKNTHTCPGVVGDSFRRITRAEWQVVLNNWASGLRVLAEHTAAIAPPEDSAVDSQGRFRWADIVLIDESLLLRRLALRVQTGQRFESARRYRQMMSVGCDSKELALKCGQSFLRWLDVDEMPDDPDPICSKDEDVVFVPAEWLR
jgi:hypothetical protein